MLTMDRVQIRKYCQIWTLECHVTTKRKFKATLLMVTINIVYKGERIARGLLRYQVCNCHNDCSKIVEKKEMYCHLNE